MASVKKRGAGRLKDPGGNVLKTKKTEGDPIVEEDPEPLKKKRTKRSEDVMFALSIEHWAEELAEALRAEFGDFSTAYNPSKPRRGAFEVIIKRGEEEKLVWSGLKKGPPRKLKFPESAVVISEIKKQLKQFSH